MTQKQADSAPSTDKKQPPTTGPAPNEPARDAPALPPATSHPVCGPHSVDVTEQMPEDVHIDSNITEGHPGYAESGDSKIIPPNRLAGQKR